MADHDQRLKSILQAFFVEFLALFFPKWAERLDASAAVWLDKEAFNDPPEGRRRVLDLLARVPVRPGTSPLPGNPTELIALVHTEIEAADRTTVAREQLWLGYAHLRSKYRLPVLPLAVYLNVGLEGVGVDEFTETFGDLEVVRFRCIYVGLPALDAVQYVAGENILGVALASLMRVPEAEQGRLISEALRRIAAANIDESRRFMLAEMVQAYWPLNEEQRKVYETMLGTPGFEGVRAMNKTERELGREEGVQTGLKQGLKQGLQQGHQQGHQQGQREAIIEILEYRFGELPPGAQNRIQTMDRQQLLDVKKRITSAQSLKDLGLE